MLPWKLHRWISLLLLGLFVVWGCSPAEPLPEGELVILPSESSSLEGNAAEQSVENPGSSDTLLEPSVPESSPNQELVSQTEQPSLPDPAGVGPEDTFESSQPEAGPEMQVGPETGPEPGPEPGPELPGPEPGPRDTAPREQGSQTGQPCQVGSSQGVCLDTKNCTGQRRSVAGFCPGPSNIQCCIASTSSGSSYCAVKIPASCQPVSNFSKVCSCQTKPGTPSHTGLKERPGQNGCPAGMVRVTNFCIDQYEAALVELLPNGQEQAWSPFLNPGQRNIKAVSIAGVTPQGYISGIQAAKACKAAGKRLCTDTEWLRACRGASNYVYPYGNTRQKNWCNEDRPKHPAIEYFGHARSCVFSYISHICINQQPNTLARTGSFPKCVTAEKVYDMMGNLHEWTAASSGIFRGGYYVDTYRNGNGCLYRTTAHTTGHWDYSTGFRCCANPAP